MSEPICEMILLLDGEKVEKAQNRKVEKSKGNGCVLENIPFLVRFSHSWKLSFV